MNKIMMLLAFLALFLLLTFISVNIPKSKSISLFQKEFRKGRIAC